MIEITKKIDLGIRYDIGIDRTMRKAITGKMVGELLDTFDAVRTWVFYPSRRDIYELQDVRTAVRNETNE